MTNEHINQAGGEYPNLPEDQRAEIAMLTDMAEDMPGLRHEQERLSDADAHVGDALTAEHAHYEEGETHMHAVAKELRTESEAEEHKRDQAEAEKMLDQ